MAAGQRKKRLNGASVIRLNFHEHSIGKKKMKLESSDIFLNMTSRVSLEWNEGKNKVVAKREQVGIMWRDMVPFLDPVPQYCMGLADVLSVPPEIFGLDNIADVLSYQVWETSLSEKERKLLIQFLPRDDDVDNVVQSLLEGENFHFGNPFCKWGASLCAGNLHPDTVRCREQQYRAAWNAYFSELKKYHSKVVENLSEIKERWTSCKKPEKEMSEKIWRKGIIKSMNGSPPVIPEKAKVLFISENEQLHNTSFHYEDTAKYMSYIKVNKQQHQLVKSIYHSGDGIQFKSLNQVLGDIKCFDVRPYEAFEEMERKRLHQHWLQLANKDLPAAFENHRELRLFRDTFRKSLQHELTEKKLMIKDDEREMLRSSPTEHVGDEYPEQKSDHVDVEDSEQKSLLDVQDEGYIRTVRFADCHHLEINSSLNCHQELSPASSNQEQNMDVLDAIGTHSINHSPVHRHLDRIPSLNSPQEHNSSAVDKGMGGHIVKNRTTSSVHTEFIEHVDDTESKIESKASSSNVHHMEIIPSGNSQIELSTLDVHDSGNQDLIGCTNNSPAVSQFLQCRHTVDGILEENRSASSPEETWRADSTGHLCSHYPSENPGYTSADELSLQQPQAPPMEESSAPIDLETQILDQDATESIASASHAKNRTAVFCLNANQDYNLLLPPLHELRVLPSHLQEHMSGSKQSELRFLVTNDGLPHPSHSPHLFHEQQEVFKQSQARERGLYMHPMLDRNTQLGSRYPSRGHFLSVGPQGWTNFQPPVSGLMGHSSYSGEYDTGNGWSGAETSGTEGQCLGDAGGADGSLFSVLSGCNKLPSHSPFVSTSSEELLPGGNFVGWSNSHGDGTCTYIPLLNNARSRDTAGSKMNSMPWMNLSLQNRGLSDSLERYWDH